MNTRQVAVLTAVFGALSTVAMAGLVQEGRLVADDRAVGDRFGNGVAIDGGGVAVVGSHRDDSDLGAAYVFARNETGWTQVTKLWDPNGSPGDAFGLRISMNADSLLVGAYGHDSAKGAVYVFDRNNWTQSDILTASNKSAGDDFGFCVSVSGNRAIIGAIGSDARGLDSGAAYIFERDVNGWNQTAILTADDGQSDDMLGFDVSISGDYAIAGLASYRTGARQGAYIFRRTESGWAPAPIQLPDDLSPGDSFGTAVSISGDYAMVTAAKQNDGQGAVYVYKRVGDEWLLDTQKKIFPLDVEHAVFIQGDKAIVGAEDCDVMGTDAGAAYMYRRTDAGWELSDTLYAGDPNTNDRFGVRVAMDGEYALIGADLKDGNTGVAYVFVPEPATLSLLALGGMALVRKGRRLHGRRG